MDNFLGLCFPWEKKNLISHDIHSADWPASSPVRERFLSSYSHSVDLLIFFLSDAIQSYQNFIDSLRNHTLPSWIAEHLLSLNKRRKKKPTPIYLPGKIPQIEEPGWLQSMGLKRVIHDRTTFHFHQDTTPQWQYISERKWWILTKWLSSKKKETVLNWNIMTWKGKKKLNW